MPILAEDQPKVFRNVKEAPAIILILILTSEIGLNWLYVHFLYDAFKVPALHTSSLITPLVVLSFLKLMFIVLGVIFWIGNFKPDHLGASSKNMKVGILSTVFTWSLMQLAFISYSFIAKESITFFPVIDQHSILFHIGSFFLFAMTKALYDEAVYRGLFLPQLHLKIRRYINLSDRITLALAIVVSQTIYLIIQIPLIDLAQGSEFNLALALLSLFFLSILNALVYLRTKNLFIGVGIHALWFFPILVVEASFPPLVILTILAIGFMLLWPHLPNVPSEKTAWPLERR